ncbi:MAG TPA: hypothetical protein PKJ97_01350 [Candidatus Bilamarchaeaceae archaeon]|nr:hypothetical protein [Candidatus Bilamarchaeaceae archaeon]
MEKKRLLSWGQGNEALAGIMADFRSGENACIAIGPAEAPATASSSNRNGIHSVKYKWKAETGLIQVHSMEYTDETLRYFHGLDERDGVDSAAFTHSGETYVLRRATRQLAKKLFASTRKIADFVSHVVGWFRTLAGNFYLVSRIDKSTWGVDASMSAPHLQSFPWSELGEEGRGKFAELATEMMVRLHRSGHVFSNPVPSEMMVDSRRALVADPRYLRPMKKSTDAIDNFIIMMRGLVRRGFSCSGTLFYCLSLYANSMEKECAEWYRKSKNSKGTLFEIALEMERKVAS